ncbi:hypothetical protein B0T14DRAFT_429475, partial [Immersiella caudata]
KKTVTLLKILFNDLLIFSPYVFLKGILFRHWAFKVPSLTCPDTVSRLNIHLGKWELPLPLKLSMDDIYIFCRAVKTLVGYEISLIKLISPVIITRWVRRVGELTGFEVLTILYNL